MPSTTTSKSPDELATAKAHLKAGRFGDARQTAESGFDSPEHREEALYISAVASRYLKDFDTAHKHLDELLNIHPTYGRAFQERGHVLKAQKRWNDALDAYQQAVRHNPALLASWRAITDLNPNDKIARSQVQRLSALPAILQSIESMMHEGRLLKAEQLCRAHLQRNPKDVEAMRLLAELGSRLSIFDDAEFLLESALEFEPDNIRVRLDYINVLQKRQKFAQCLEESEKLYESDPENPRFASSYANACMSLGRFDDAIALYEKLSKTHPEFPGNELAKGHALKTVGNTEDAITAYRSAATQSFAYGNAYWSLANLKTYKFTDAEIAQMRALADDANIDVDNHYHLCFALGKAFEDQGNYEDAFHYYKTGNALKKADIRYSSDRMSDEMAAQQQQFTPEFLEAMQGSGHDAPDPIFIVGLPRAGSTLLEQILSSHSKIDGTLELPNILALAHRLNGRRRVDEAPRYPSVLGEIDKEKFVEFGQKFIEETRIHRQSAPYFTDKMPNNFRHIGLIHLILPNAKIIDARRNAMDCCFSGFKQLFAEGQEFTYGLEDIGRYYKDYVALMDHWDKVLPGKILRVQYEDVVADVENQVRRILEYLELPFEQACVDFHKTKRAVRTASSEQVRQKINTKGVDQWRHFEPWLGPLKEALGALAKG